MTSTYEETRCNQPTNRCTLEQGHKGSCKAETKPIDALSKRELLTLVYGITQGAIFYKTRGEEVSTGLSVLIYKILHEQYGLTDEEYGVVSKQISQWFKLHNFMESVHDKP